MHKKRSSQQSMERWSSWSTGILAWDTSVLSAKGLFLGSDHAAEKLWDIFYVGMMFLFSWMSLHSTALGWPKVETCWLACSRQQLLDGWSWWRTSLAITQAQPWAWVMAKPPKIRAASEWDGKGHESFGERLERNGSGKGRNERGRHHKEFCCPRPRTALFFWVPRRARDGQKSISKITQK